VIRDPRDLNPATSGIADELSKQYHLGYPATGKKDGRWHAIRVQVRNGSYGSAPAGDMWRARMSRAASRDRADPEPAR
jgi:hypothetical protein